MPSETLLQICNYYVVGLMSLTEAKIIVKDQFLDFVVDVLQPSSEKLRLIINDKSFIDIRISRTIVNRFDFHWERREVNGTIYRYDNFPDIKFKHLKTFPCHFHTEEENKVVEADFSQDAYHAFIDFMEFVRDKLKTIKKDVNKK